MAIVKRTDKSGKTRYMVRVEATDPMTGNRRRVTVGTFATKREADKAEAQGITARERGTLLDRDRTTVAELMAAWLDTKRGEITGQSLRDYQIIVTKHILPALGGVSVQKLTAARLQAQYAAWQAEGMSARMVRGCHLRLSQALKQAVRFGIVSANVCDSVSPPRLSRSKADTWNQMEAAAFLHAAMNRPVLSRGGDTGKRQPDELHPLWHLLLLEGMRRGEGLGLRWRDINFDRGTAHIVQTVAPNKADKGKALIQERTKTNAGARTVRLTARTLDALREHRKAQNLRRLAAPDWADNDLIVCTSRGTPVNPNNVSRSFNAIVAAARLANGTPLRRIRVHDLRHTSATLLLLGGTPAKIVSERLGHASVGITLDLYSHVLPDMQADAAAAMDDILNHALSGIA
jgi:integrase